MKRLLKPFQNQHGVIIIGAFMVTFFFLVTSLAVAEFATSHYVSTKRTLVAAAALNAAEAGADAFMFQINQNTSYQGTTSAPSSASNSCSGYTINPITILSDTTHGRITYESCVQDGTVSGEKIVMVTGKAYLPTTSTTPKVTRKIRLIIAGTGLTPGFKVATGNGGLIMSNSANIGSGEFYINGRLLMSNNSVIGDASGARASVVHVAGSGCGTGASYPQICSGATGQTDLPIYVSNSAHIYADVHSPNMTGGGFDGNATRQKMTAAGLVDGDAPVIAMPDNNRATVMARNTWTNRSASVADCPSGQNTTTWAAGTHFTGNINVDGSCAVTVAGDVWISGNFQLSNSASLQVGNGVTGPPNLLIDGANGFRPSNSTSLIPNAAGTAFEVRTYWSAAGACPSSTPSVCPVPTGAQLQTSTNTRTIEFSNSFTAPGSSFYAVWSGLRVNNGTNVGQLLAQKVELANSGTLTFGGGTITAGNDGDWDVKFYEQVY